ncbi:hypothetical protein AVEN_236936-1 [Araneus ventricosus]|uniref:MADF domain-containing protein n=1 Tax=Araneus ventricosus TaxID=182803 RepID=A0A4Y2NSC5_ARAVE|nr:hypothetical protein AVEN_236936-1 [Araneus ventricosus]
MWTCLTSNHTRETKRLSADNSPLRRTNSVAVGNSQLKCENDYRAQEGTFGTSLVLRKQINCDISKMFRIEYRSCQFPSNKIVKRWRNIRDTYARSLREKNKSGHAAVSTKKYISADQLSFLLTAGARTETQFSLKETVSEEDTEQQNGL